MSPPLLEEQRSFVRRGEGWQGSRPALSALLTSLGRMPSRLYSTFSALIFLPLFACDQHFARGGMLHLWRLAFNIPGPRAAAILTTTTIHFPIVLPGQVAPLMNRTVCSPLPIHLSLIHEPAIKVCIGSALWIAVLRSYNCCLLKLPLLWRT